MNKSMFFILLVMLGFLASCGVESPVATDESVTQVESESLSTEIDAVSDSLDEVSEYLDVPYQLVGDKHIFTTDSGQEVSITPVSHATAVMQWADQVVYADPADVIEGQPDPSIVFVSHEHGDHFNNDTLSAIKKPGVTFLVSQKVFDGLLPDLQEQAIVMNNNDVIELNGFSITAVPAYNIREEALKYHPEGNGNGYVFERDDYSVYFSGDSEDTPEMRALRDIDVAFVSMNLPFTMSVESATSAILEFAPTYVFPYHYRGKSGLSDLTSLSSELSKQGSTTKMILGDWYNQAK